jgi:hypothetical protein
MLRTAKHILYFLIVVGIVFLYWFLPKYSYIHKNPSFCTSLTKHLYYCGSNAGLDKLFQ